MLEASLVIHRELGDPENIAATLSTLSMTRLETGDAAGAPGTRWRPSTSSVSWGSG